MTPTILGVGMVAVLLAGTATASASQSVSSDRTEILSQFPPADETVLALLYSVYGIGTRAEQELSFTSNVAEAEVSSCMSDAGFRYEPVDSISADPRWELSPEEYASTYGFGLVANRRGDYPTVDDPNNDYISELSEGQRDAFFEQYERCRLGDEAELRYRYFDAFTVASQEFRERLMVDVNIVDAVDSWSECMAESGYEYSSPDVMRDTLAVEVSQASSAEELDELFGLEVNVASANVPCISPYTQSFRDVVASRFDEFLGLLDTALADSATPEGRG